MPLHVGEAVSWLLGKESMGHNVRPVMLVELKLFIALLLVPSVARCWPTQMGTTQSVNRWDASHVLRSAWFTCTSQPRCSHQGSRRFGCCWLHAPPHAHSCRWDADLV